MGVWGEALAGFKGWAPGQGRSPSEDESFLTFGGVQGHSPWSGGQGTKPPEAESFLTFGEVQGQSPWSGSQGEETPEGESFLTFGRPREAVTFGSFTISGKLSTPEFLHPFLTFYMIE